MIRAARPCGGPILAVGSRVLRADCCAVSCRTTVSGPREPARYTTAYTRHIRYTLFVLSIVGGIKKSLIMYTSHMYSYERTRR